jgi:2'-5' RNA ligase
VRLFVALRPPPEAVADLRAQLPRWPTAPDRWHITLAFLGEVADPAPVEAELRNRLTRIPPFVLSLAGSGAFGGGHVWVGVGGEVQRLHDLAGRVAAAARAAGVDVERRPYRPHLTVGRRRQPDPRRLADYRGPDWRADEVELVRSDLGRTVVHTVLERYRLG